ncbi:MAG: flagellar hook-length control protein FliK [Alphaproteobacteria bacterium]
MASLSSSSDNMTSDSATGDSASSQTASSSNSTNDGSQSDQNPTAPKTDTNNGNQQAEAGAGGSNNQSNQTHGASAKAKTDDKNSGKAGDGKGDDDSSTQTAGQNNAQPALLALAAVVTPPAESIQVQKVATGGDSAAGSETVGKTATASTSAGSTPPASSGSNAQTPSLVAPAPNAGAGSNQNGNQNSSQNNDGKPGQGLGKLPARISITDDSNTLVSRPPATRAAVSADGMTNSNSQTDNAGQTASQSGQPALASNSAPADGKASATPVATMTVDLSAGKTGAPVPMSSTDSGPQVQTQPQGAANTALTAVTGVQQMNAPTGASATDQPGAVQTRANELTNIANLDQVAVHITKAVGDGLDKISIQLKPESLGRIDVQLQVAHDGRVSAVIAADRQDTLSLLQRDARSLQQALSNAGLRTDTGSLSFNLSGQGQFGTPQSFSNSSPAAVSISDAALAETAPVNASTMTYNSTAANGGIDIRV